MEDFMQDVIRMEDYYKTPRSMYVIGGMDSSDPYYVLTFAEPKSPVDVASFIDPVDLHVEMAIHPERFTDENVDDSENGPQGEDYGDKEKMCEILNASKYFQDAGCTITHVLHIS